MTLLAAVGGHRGSLRLDVELSVSAGETVAVLGPNGAGKSSLLRAVAGLWPIEWGRIELEHRGRREVLDDPVERCFVPAERRRFGVVFQDYLLFAHLSALDNVAFGRRARGERASAARAVAGDWLDRLGLSGLRNHRADQLSGGQAQRVALARALAIDPAVLLLDEPLAALDASTRAGVRRELRAHLAGFDGHRILVTHDPLDAYALADRVVVVEQGRVVQAGALADVTMHPRSAYVADLVGLNLLEGQLSGSILTLASGARVVVGSQAGTGAAFGAIRPSAISLHPGRPDGSPRNAWPALVSEIDVRGDRVRVKVEGALTLVAEITPAAMVSLGLQPGDEVWAAVKATEVTTYPA